MGLTLEVISLKESKAHIGELLTEFDSINQELLDNRFESGYITSITEGGINLHKDSNFNSIAKTTRFQTVDGLDFGLLMDNEPFDEFCNAYDVILANSKFDEEEAKIKSEMASSINRSYRLEWVFSDKESKIFGLSFLLSLAMVFNGLLYNINTKFEYQGCYNIEQIRDMLKKELSSTLI